MHWSDIIEPELKKPYFKSIVQYVNERKKVSYVVPQNFLRAFEETPFDKIRVVIVGQDPYHGHRQANGLAFSVNRGVDVPPSLKNIYKELNDDLGVPVPGHGDLSAWANQGVLLLNTALTVEIKKPAAHSSCGWHIFTDYILNSISTHRRNVVFMLWGNHARKKSALIDISKHLILESPHPSPFSAHTGFFGCKHFSKANQYLKDNKRLTIDWTLHG